MCDMIVNMSSAPTLTLFVMSGSASRTKSSIVISLLLAVYWQRKQASQPYLWEQVIFLFRPPLLWMLKYPMIIVADLFLLPFFHVNTSCNLILQKMLHAQCLWWRNIRKLLACRPFFFLKDEFIFPFHALILLKNF